MFYGAFEVRNPFLVVRDPELIKKITVKDFDHFTNHRIAFDPEDEPLFGYSLFSLKDQKWKDMRATLSPAFTGSKMRQMFQLVEKTCRTAVKFLKEEARKDDPFVIEMKELFTRYTNDVIATAAFGLEIDSLSDKENQFYKMGKKATNFSGLASIKFFLWANFKQIMKVLNIRIFDAAFTKFFYKLVLETIEYRSKNNIIRPDMIQLMMEARKGELKQTEDHNVTPEGEGFAVVEESSIGKRTVKREWSDDEIVSQCFIFFFAGFEPTSVLMCFCAHEIMENPDVQSKLLEEVDQVKDELNGQPLTYEHLQKMKYLDMVVSETLRKWPPVVAIDRVCSKPYTLYDDETDSKVDIDVGDYLWIPTAALHRDPKYYPNPEKFDPERFNSENKNKIDPFVFGPFGIGPRNCIGSRFALLESKAIIYYLLSEFTFEVSAKTSIPIELKQNGFQLQPKKGFWIHLKPRN